MSNNETLRAYEFRCVGDEPAVDVQIDDWIKKYPHVSIEDIKYQVVPYVNEEQLNFATFAMVLYRTGPETSGDISHAVTQQMKIPPELAKRRR